MVKVTNLLALFALGHMASAANLRIRIVDESGTPIWARLEVYGPDGVRHLPSNAVVDSRFRTAKNPTGYQASFVVEGECAMDVPAGDYKVIAEHGLEYERVEQTLRVTGSEAPATIRLRPWVRANKLGWWSGDMHVHRPLEDIQALALAEDLNLSIVFTMWNRRNLWAEKPVPADPVMRFSPRHLATVMNAEDERGGGAWMLHQLSQPLALAVDGRWFPPGIRFVREARSRKSPGAVFPWFDSEKLIWWETPVIMALEPPDSVGVLHNHFNQYGVMNNEAWGRPRDGERFPGIAGLEAYTTGLYHRYLNLGFRMPPTAGSASGVLPNPVGYNRMYVELQGPFTVENWYKTLRSGRSFVTNGPLLFFNVKASGGSLRGSVEAIARDPLDRIEIIGNGTILKTITPAVNSRRWKEPVNLDTRKHSWVAARCYVKNDATVRFAHTSPVYLPGIWDARADAQYFVAWIDELISLSTQDPKRFASEAERDEVIGLYRQARDFYSRK